MRSFYQARNFVIQNLSQIEYRSENIKGFERLQNHIVSGASHDAGERYDAAPKCHPETRTAVLTDIKSWVDNTNEQKRVMWLHGPAGAGKSAIAQTTAEDCHKDGKLAASFFFSRLSRNQKDGLVASISYQICLSMPQVKEHVVMNIENNPNIFKSNILTQMKSLVIEPINLVHQERGCEIVPMLIIIDGLDECEKKKDREEIITAVFAALSMEKAGQLRVLLVSRPELEIQGTFNQDNISPLCIRIALDDKLNADKDIDLFLRSQFQTIKRRHVLGPALSESWPSNESIRQIVQKSSGQFIYASTVMHFISDPQRNPRKALDIILQIKPGSGDRPFTELDALYSAILYGCVDYERVASIFEAMMFSLERNSILRSTEALDAFLSLEREPKLHLVNLHSIIDLTYSGLEGIRFYHASLYDFLTDDSRSDKFYIDEMKAHAHLSIRCFDTILNAPLESSLDIVIKYSVRCGFSHYACSNWDDSVLDYIRASGLLDADNSRIKEVQRNNHSHVIKSMLGNLIYSTKGPLKIVANASVHDVIDTEFQNHLKGYPPAGLFILYHCTAWHSTSNLFHYFCKSYGSEVVDQTNNVMNHDIFFDSYVYSLFRDFIKTTGYIDQLSIDIQIESINCILDMIMQKPFGHHKFVETMFLCMFDNIPKSSRIAYEVFRKWEVIKKDEPLDGLKQNTRRELTETMRKIEDIIQRYCMNSFQQTSGT